MKLVAVFAFVLVLGFVAAENNNWGSLTPQDRLLVRSIVTKKSKFMQVVTQDYTWPPAGQPNFAKIAAIKVTDQKQNGNGGYATLQKDGVGTSSVTLHLKSKRNHGFDFIIEIYGH